MPKKQDNKKKQDEATPEGFSSFDKMTVEQLSETNEYQFLCSMFIKEEDKYDQEDENQDEEGEFSLLTEEAILELLKEFNDFDATMKRL